VLLELVVAAKAFTAVSAVISLVGISPSDHYKPPLVLQSRA
jgi:hypothetical protein